MVPSHKALVPPSTHSCQKEQYRLAPPQRPWGSPLAPLGKWGTKQKLLGGQHQPSVSTKWSISLGTTGRLLKAALPTPVPTDLSHRPTTHTVKEARGERKPREEPRRAGAKVWGKQAARLVGSRVEGYCMILLNDLGAHNQHCHFLQNDIPRKLLPLASSKSCEATDKQGLEESNNSLTAEHCPVISEVSLFRAALERQSPMR